MSTTMAKVKHAHFAHLKIGNLLLDCLINNRHLADHISEPYAKLYGKW